MPGEIYSQVAAIGQHVHEMIRLCEGINLRLPAAQEKADRMDALKGEAEKLEHQVAKLSVEVAALIKTRDSLKSDIAKLLLKYQG